MRLLREEGILRRSARRPALHTQVRPEGGGGERDGGPSRRWRRRCSLYRGKSGGKKGAAGGPAPRVDSRYTAATSVSAMSARSDFYNAPCTLPHSRSLTPSHPPPRRGAEDLRERRASASVSRGDLRASERASERPSLEPARVPFSEMESIRRFQQEVC